MPEPLDPRSIIEAAEQAAAAGNHASAEELLREAARVQEASLGPLHPDLANTLNNLGVVCEITEKPGDAEHFFRRAYAIATTVLPPDHPFVATSRKNLEDFCQARGIAVDSSTPLPAVVAEPEVLAIDAPYIPPERSPYEDSQPVASRRWSRSFAIGVMIAGGLLLGFIGTAMWSRGNNDEGQSSLGSTSQLPPADPIATDVPKESKSDTPTVREVTKSPPVPPAPAERRATKASVPQRPLVAAVQLCSSLSTGGPGDWRCVAPSLPVGPGSLIFYTRLKSQTDTTVLHRWYRGATLVQAVELPIRANTTDGYRTYSRSIVDNQGEAEWRIELRTKDGALLHEERFAVR
jgi:hypothetical protein